MHAVSRQVSCAVPIAVHEVQRIAVEQSRLHIPLLVGLDIIHGHRTLFPIPLAETALFDPEAWALSAREASREGAADGIAMTVIFPMMFLSGIFVPVAGLPDGLRQIAELNPLTTLATATRQLFGSPTGPIPDVWMLQHPVWASLGWAALLMAVFVPLSIRRYKRMGS